MAADCASCIHWAQRGPSRGETAVPYRRCSASLAACCRVCLDPWSPVRMFATSYQHHAFAGIVAEGVRFDKLWELPCAYTWAAWRFVAHHGRQRAHANATNSAASSQSDRSFVSQGILNIGTKTYYGTSGSVLHVLRRNDSMTLQVVCSCRGTSILIDVNLNTRDPKLLSTAV